MSRAALTLVKVVYQFSHINYIEINAFEESNIIVKIYWNFQSSSGGSTYSVANSDSSTDVREDRLQQELLDIEFKVKAARYKKLKKN